MTARLQKVTVSLRRKTAKRKVETSRERKKVLRLKARKVREEKQGAGLKVRGKKGVWKMPVDYPTVKRAEMYCVLLEARG